MLMNFEVLMLFVILVVMIYLFLAEKLPIDLTAFLGVIVLVVGGYITVDEAFSGFSSPVVIIMLATFVLAAGIEQTGLANRLAKAIQDILGNNEAALVAATIILAAFFSAFMNNVAAAAILLPVIISMAVRSEVSPSRLLIPLSFGTLLGGTLTLIGTPPNLLAAGVLAERGYQPFGFFDFSIFGLAFVAVGLAFIVPFGRHMLPRRNSLRRGKRLSELAEYYRIHERLFAMRVPKSFSLSGKTLAECNIGGLLGVEVVAIVRGKQKHLSPTADEKILGGDLLLVEGRIDEIEKLLGLRGVRLASYSEKQWEIKGSDLCGITLRVPEDSTVLGNALSQLDLHQKLGLLVVGIERQGSFIYHDLTKQTLQEGDSLHTIGSEQSLNELEDYPDFELLDKSNLGASQLSRGQLFTLHIPVDSVLDGKTLGASRIGELTGLTIVALRQGDEIVWAPGSEELLQAGAKMLMTGDSNLANRIIELAQLRIESKEVDVDLETEKSGVIEVVLSPRSSLIGRTVRQIEFRERYGFQVLALWREGRPRRARFADEALRFGNALLLQGPRSKVHYLAQDPDFLLLTDGNNKAVRPEKSIFVVIGVLLMVLLSAFQLQPPEMAAFMAAAFVALTGAVTLQEAYGQIEWRVVFLVAALIPVGIALENTGAAVVLAQGVLSLVGDAGPYFVLLAFVLLSSVISQLLDGILSVVLLSTIALQTSEQLGVSPYPFIMAIALAASIAFIAPFSHKANLLVMSAGGYSARDFFKIGSILTLLLLIVVVVLVPVVLPF